MTKSELDKFKLFYEYPIDEENIVLAAVKRFKNTKKGLK